MRLLLDTHALIWWWLDDPALPSRAREVMSDPVNDVYVSAATGWEVATKVRKGHLPAFERRVAHFERDVTADGFHPLPVTLAHGVTSGSLVGTHKDPFDRMLVAQALMEDLTLVTCDRALADLGCETFW